MRSTVDITKKLDEVRKTLSAHAGVLEAVEKTIFPSPAGKKRIASKLAKMLPDHRVYVEPFAGSAAVFFSKKAAPVEVLSDGNPEIANAYRRLKALTPAGVDALRQKDWVGSVDTFNALRLSQPANDIDALHKFLYLRKFSFGKFDRTMDPFRVGRASHVFHRIAQFGPRLKNAQIFDGDYEKVVRKFDGPDTVFFLDPPYPGYDAHVGESSFDEERFLNVVKSLKGKCLITYGVRGKFPAALKQLDGWIVKKIRPVRMNTGRTGNRGAHRLEQLVAMNYEPTAKSAEWLSSDEELVDVTLEELEKAACGGGKAPRKIRMEGTRKEFDVVEGLKNFGPPNEWSGAVASIAGPERRRAMEALWKEMSAKERAEIQDAFDKNFAKAFKLLTRARGRGRCRKADSVAKVVDFQGISVQVDRPAGFEQKGIDDQGTEWTRVYQCDYGFLQKTAGGDGEELDVFLGPDPMAPTAFWVEQKKSDGSFDEFKVFLGFGSQEEAVATYKAHIPERFMGPVFDVGVGAMRSLLGLDPVQKRFEVTSKILKGIDPSDERFVLGIVLEPETVDAQGDIYSEAEIRQAAHRFMQDFTNIGLQHQALVNGKVKILESYLAPADFTADGFNVKKGTWMMAVRVLDDELWSACKDGTLTGFSIGGSARRVAPTEAPAA